MLPIAAAMTSFAPASFADTAAAQWASIVDTPPEPAFDDLARRAAEALGAPMAAISFFDGSREWFKACHGIALREWPRHLSLFREQQPFARVFRVTDANADAVLGRHPLVAGAPHLRFYAGAAIMAGDGSVCGVLSVFDSKPRELNARDNAALCNLADLVQARLAARRGQSPGAGNARPASAGHAVGETALLARRLEDEITARKAAEEQLWREKEFAGAAIESLPGAFYMFSGNGRMLRWNGNFEAFSGYARAEILAMHPLDFIAEKDRAAVASAIQRVFADGAEVTLEADLRAKSGAVAPYVFTGKPLQLGGETVLIGIGHDISKRKRAEAQMSQAKERLDLALSGSGLALWDWDLAINMAYFNEGWAQLTGAPPREAIFRGEEVVSWNHPDDREIFSAAFDDAVKGGTTDFNAEYRILNEAGEWIWIFSRGKVTQRDASGRALRMTGTSSNITKRKLAEERAEFLATRDPLTGLPNRMLLNDRLEQGIASAARNRTRLAFMFIDLDRFKTINDSLGHHVGDELLKQVAARLSSCVRATDTVARLGGDEFAVILEDVRSDDGAHHVAANMIASLASAIFVGSLQLNTSCSIGIGLFPADGRDSATLMKNADAAMYSAKEKGRNNFQFFSADMNTRAIERHSIESYLRQALSREELLLHYQPRIAFANGTVVGVEALIRWQHPRRGLIAPDKFISVAEESGLIVPIGEWALESACRQVREWQQRGMPELKLAVNVSVGQARDGERLLRAIDNALTQSGLNARFLELELTESLLMNNIEEKVELLNRLGARGTSLSIDDFGTGYSSLYYLKRLPVDSVKIDGSFVRDIVDDPNDEVIVRAIVAMSHSMRLRVVAEAVETDEQYTALKALGCDEYQGFHFSAALPAEEFETKYLGS
jgi:diguanylate cyclase (GGDEF)-like protein/PAS domain S-box-containing protein